MKIRRESLKKICWKILRKFIKSFKKIPKKKIHWEIQGKFLGKVHWKIS